MYTRESARYRDTELKLAGLPYRGRSIGSEETCHTFPGFGTAFDIGGAPLGSTTCSAVFITHGHEDHVGGIVQHVVRRAGWGLAPATYYVQEEDLKLVHQFTEAHRRLARSRGSVRLEPVGEGSVIPLPKGGVEVRPFRAVHRIPCMGYGVWRRRTRLRKQYRGLSRNEIIALKKQGVEIEEEVSLPEVAYPGDTSIDVLDGDAAEVVTTAKVLLLECTFLDQQVDRKQAHKTGHIHIDDFVAAARDGAFQNEVILLTHFSARYSPRQVEDLATARLRDEDIWERVRLLLPHR